MDNLYELEKNLAIGDIITLKIHQEMFLSADVNEVVVWDIAINELKTPLAFG